MAILREGAGQALGAVLAVLALGTASYAAEPEAATEEVPVSAVRSFHEALSSGDRAGALAWLDPAVVIFEQGGAEMSRDEYGSNHLQDDIEFTRATTSKTIDQRSGKSGDAAWVLTISQTSGSFHGKAVSTRNAETMVLAHGSAGWRITHIHWSSHANK